MDRLTDEQVPHRAKDVSFLRARPEEFTLFKRSIAVYGFANWRDSEWATPERDTEVANFIEERLEELAVAIEQEFGQRYPKSSDGRYLQVRFS